MILPKSRTVGLRFVLAGLLEFHVLKLILVKKEEKRTDLSESSIWTKFWWKYKLFKCLKSSSNWDCYQYGENLEIALHSRGAYALAKIRTNRPVVITAPRELWELVTVHVLRVLHVAATPQDLIEDFKAQGQLEGVNEEVYVRRMKGLYRQLSGVLPKKDALLYTA